MSEQSTAHYSSRRGAPAGRAHTLRRRKRIALWMVEFRCCKRKETALSECYSTADKHVAAVESDCGALMPGSLISGETGSRAKDAVFGIVDFRRGSVH